MKSKHSRLERKYKHYHVPAEGWQLSQDENKELERRQQVLQGLSELNRSDPGGARAIPGIVFHNISSSRRRQLAEEYPARNSQGASVGHLDYAGAIKEGLNDEEFATLENSFHAYVNLPAELQQKWQSDLRASKPDRDEHKSRKEYERVYATWTAEGLCSLNKLAKEAQAAGYQHSESKSKPAVKSEVIPEPKQQSVEAQSRSIVGSETNPEPKSKGEFQSQPQQQKPVIQEKAEDKPNSADEKDWDNIENRRAVVRRIAMLGRNESAVVQEAMVQSIGREISLARLAMLESDGKARASLEKRRKELCGDQARTQYEFSDSDTSTISKVISNFSHEQMDDLDKLVDEVAVLAEKDPQGMERLRSDVKKRSYKLLDEAVGIRVSDFLSDEEKCKREADLAGNSHSSIIAQTAQAAEAVTRKSKPKQSSATSQPELAPQPGPEVNPSSGQKSEKEQPESPTGGEGKGEFQPQPQLQKPVIQEKAEDAPNPAGEKNWDNIENRRAVVRRMTMLGDDESDVVQEAMLESVDRERFLAHLALLEPKGKARASLEKRLDELDDDLERTLNIEGKFSDSDTNSIFKVISNFSYEQMDDLDKLVDEVAILAEKDPQGMERLRSDVTQRRHELSKKVEEIRLSDFVSNKEYCKLTADLVGNSHSRIIAQTREAAEAVTGKSKPKQSSATSQPEPAPQPRPEVNPSSGQESEKEQPESPTKGKSRGEGQGSAKNEEKAEDAPNPADEKDWDNIENRRAVVRRLAMLGDDESVVVREAMLESVDREYYLASLAFLESDGTSHSLEKRREELFDDWERTLDISGKFSDSDTSTISKVISNFSHEQMDDLDKLVDEVTTLAEKDPQGMERLCSDVRERSHELADEVHETALSDSLSSKECYKREADLVGNFYSSIMAQTREAAEAVTGKSKPKQSSATSQPEPAPQPRPEVNPSSGQESEKEQPESPTKGKSRGEGQGSAKNEEEPSSEDLPKLREKMSKYVGGQVLNDKMRSELLKQAFIRPLGQERMAELQQQYGGEVNSAAEMIVKSIQDADGLNGKECYRLSGLLNDLDALPDSDVRRIIQSGIFKNGIANAKNRSGTEGAGSDFSAELRDLIHQKAERIRQTKDLRLEYQNSSESVREMTGELVDRDKFSRYDEASSTDEDRGDELVRQLGGKPEDIHDALMSKDGINLLTDEEVASYRRHLSIVKGLSADSLTELLYFSDDLNDLKNGVVPPDIKEVVTAYQDKAPDKPEERRAYNQAQTKLYQMEADKASELARAELEESLAPRRKLTDQIFNKNVNEGAMSLLYTELMMKSFSKERYEEVIETFRNVRNGKRTDFGDFIQCRNASEPGVPDPRGMTQEEFERLAELTPLVLGLSKSQVKQLLESEEKEKTRLSKGDPNDPELWQKRQQYSAALEQRIRRMVRDNDAENVNMASVDRSRIVEMKAYIDAKRKLDKDLTPKPEDFNAKGKLKLGARVRGAVARLWKGKIFRDYYEFKYQRELKEQYSKDFAHTLGANSGDGSASSAETEQALIWRMTQDSDFFTDTVGEEREQLSPDSEAYKAMRRAVETFVENGNEEAFIEETRRINNDLMGNEGMPILDNYLTSAIYIKGQVDHGRALNDVMRGFKMYQGTSAEGVNSGHHERAIDKLVAKFERKKTGWTLSIKPEAVAGVAGLASWIGGAVARNRAVQAVSFGGSAVVAGVLAGVKENEQVKIDRADLARRIAEGGQVDEDNKYEMELAETLPEMRTAESYMEVMDQAIASGDADRMRQVLADLVVAREVGRNEGVDLIDYYSGGGDAEVVRNELTSRQFALEQAYIRTNKDPNLELGRYKDQLMDGLSAATQAYGAVFPDVNGALLNWDNVPENVREQIIKAYEMQAARDRVAKKLRRRRVAKEWAVTTARTLAFSTIGQEIAAFARSDVHGAVEDMLAGQHGDAPNAARTALGNLLNTPSGGAVGEVVAGGNRPEKQFYREGEINHEQIKQWQAEGYKVEKHFDYEPQEHQVTISAEDAVKGNPTFHRAGWLDYGTERPDYNELLGRHGEGSSYIFNPRGGSYGYGMSMSREDIIQAAREGHIKLMVSPTRGTQSNPFSVGNVIVEDNGLINFNPDAITQPAAADMMVNRSYAFAEVVDDRTGMVLATEVGSGTADSFTQTAKEMVNTLTGYDITPPVDQVISSVPVMPDVEPLPPIPGYRGTRRLSTDDELRGRPARAELRPGVDPSTLPPAPTPRTLPPAPTSTPTDSVSSRDNDDDRNDRTTGSSGGAGTSGDSPDTPPPPPPPGGGSSSNPPSSNSNSSSDGKHNLASRKISPFNYLSLGSALGGEFREQSSDIGFVTSDDSNVLLPGNADSGSQLLHSYFAHVPESIPPVSPDALKDVEEGVRELVRDRDNHVTYDDEDRFGRYRPSSNLAVNNLIEFEERPNGDSVARLSTLGRNFLGILGTNERMYNYDSTERNGIYSVYQKDQRGGFNYLRRSVATNFGTLYNKIRSGVVSELNDVARRSNLSSVDLGKAKEIFIEDKDKKGQFGLSLLGTYAAIDYFDDSIREGRASDISLTGFIDTYNKKYATDKARRNEWMGAEKEGYDNLLYHNEIGVRSELLDRLGRYDHDFTSRIERNLNTKRFLNQSKIDARRILGDAFGLFDIDVSRSYYTVETTPRPTHYFLNKLLVRLNDAGKRALERYTKEELVSVPDDKLGINLLDFVKSYNAGKYRDPTPLTA